mmetsp:Transcript_24819/g.78687  ORF Transcript_24819/g.78687 Transcript_24819/m.78687 type:complete len:405 (-) Transcript_24819:550-1764(-)
MQRRHGDDALRRLGHQRRLDRRAEDGRLDRAARQLVRLAQPRKVDVSVQRRLRGNEEAPEPAARRGVGRGELEDELEAPVEGGVDLLEPVRDGDDDAREGLHVVQQHADVHRVVPRGRASLGAPLGKQALALVEHEHRLLRLGLVEDLLDVLGRLANVLVHQLSAVDHHQRAADVKPDSLGRHRLARAGRAMEERGDALRAAVLLVEAPLAKQHRLRLGVGDHLAELVLDRGGQLHLLEPARRDDAAVHLGHREPPAQLVRRAGVQVRLRDLARGALPRDGQRQRRQPGVLDEAARQLELARERHEIDVVAERQLWRRHAPPDLLAQQQVGLGELDGEGDAPVHRLVQVHRPVGGEDAESLVPLELGEDGVDLQVALRAVHEDRLALVEEEDRVVDLGLAEDEL